MKHYVSFQWCDFWPYRLCIFNENGVEKVRNHGILLHPFAFCLAVHCSRLLEARDFLLHRREFLGHGKDDTDFMPVNTH